MPCTAPARAALGLPANGFVFCSFNNLYKFTAEYWAVWMRLLARVDASVLWLLCDNPAAQANLVAATRAHGVDPARLVFAPRIPNHDHIARLRAADLFLDTAPYNASRVGGSVLHAAGLPELVTTTLADYEKLAGDLATDPSRLQALRAKLDAARTSAPLFNTALFVRNLEAAYVTMLTRAAQGFAPEAFAVAAPE